MHLKKQWIWYCAFVQMLPQLLICIQVCMHNVQTMGKMYLYPHFPVACFLCAASPDPGQGRGLELDTRQYNYRYINIYLMKIKQWWWLETMGLVRIFSCWINMSACPILYFIFIYLKEIDGERVSLTHKSPFTWFINTLVSLIFISS